jgi:peroxiredoxin
MTEQAQLRQRKDELESLGAAAYVVLAMDLYRTTVFKEENLLVSTFPANWGTPFSKEKSLVHATALSDPAGSASAVYGVSRKAIRWGGWVENKPTWFVIDRKGTITYSAHPTFSSPTHYVKDVDLVFEALKKASK